MRKNTIALLANKETESVRALDKYFIPNESIQNADVYCFGKIIQFIMAHIQCEPHLSKREEYKLQKIVKKCLGANPKSRYEEIHMVQMLSLIHISHERETLFRADEKQRKALNKQ